MRFPHASCLHEVCMFGVKTGKALIDQLCAFIAEKSGEFLVAIPDDPMRGIDHRHRDLAQKNARFVLIFLQPSPSSMPYKYG